MSWSDEWEGCDRCSFRKKPSADTCKGCKSGDRWNRVDWDDADDVEAVADAAYTEYVLGARR